MTPLNRSISSLFLNPIALALCTSSLAFAAGALSPSAHEGVASRSLDGAVILEQAGVVLAEGNVEVTQVEPRLTEGEITVNVPDPQTDLAVRFADALTRPTKPSLKAKRSRPLVSEQGTSKVWVCGSWEDLWQGRGQGRSCEWK